MPSKFILGQRLVGLLVLCLLLKPLQIARADPMAWRDARDMSALMAQLDLWLDKRSYLPKAERPPMVRLVDRHALPALVGAHFAAHGGQTRGLYDPDTVTIWLIRPWDARDPRDVSVLLHEMIHHRQNGLHWYCPGAQELPAYRLQEQWLNKIGLSVSANWVAVVLEAGCTPRDIHPD